jgi:hypothetical protein
MTMAIDDVSTIVDLPVEMDCEMRNAGKRSIDMKQDIGSIFEMCSPREAKIPIEPTAEDRRAVNLDRELSVLVATAIDARFEMESR